LHQVALRSRVACHLRVWSGLQGLRERRLDGGAVLMYHGVVARARDPVLEKYTIDVTSFRSHLDFFRRTHEFVPLSRMVECLGSRGRVPRHWMAITLDDALSNQATTAAEILAEGAIPWALAVPAGLIGTGRSIWTYEFRFLLLECWPFPSVPWPSDSPEERPTRSATEKRAVLRSLVPHLFHLRDDRRTTYLESLIDRAGRAEFLARMAADGRFTLATWSQIESLRASGVELLSHGWLHRPQNATIRPEALVEEIAQSRQLMGERLGEPPAGFALPHGEKSSATDDLIAAAGYTFCLSSLARRVTGSTDRRDIPRFASEYPLAVLRRHLLGHSDQGQA